MIHHIDYDKEKEVFSKMHGILEGHSFPLKFWVPPKVTNFIIPTPF